MIIDDIGEMAVLMQIAQECGRVSIAAMDRIQELQTEGRADCERDLGMRDLIEAISGMFTCIEEIEKRYPEISDAILRYHTANRVCKKKAIRRTDRKIREGILNNAKACDRIQRKHVYECKVSVRN